jgi:hypothetical protein
MQSGVKQGVAHQGRKQRYESEKYVESLSSACTRRQISAAILTGLGFISATFECHILLLLLYTHHAPFLPTACGNPLLEVEEEFKGFRRRRGKVSIIEFFGGLQVMM